MSIKNPFHIIRVIDPVLAKKFPGEKCDLPTRACIVEDDDRSEENLLAVESAIMSASLQACKAKPHSFPFNSFYRCIAARESLCACLDSLWFGDFAFGCRGNSGGCSFQELVDTIRVHLCEGTSTCCPRKTRNFAVFLVVPVCAYSLFFHLHDQGFISILKRIADKSFYGEAELLISLLAAYPYVRFCLLFFWQRASMLARAVRKKFLSIPCVPTSLTKSSVPNALRKCIDLFLKIERKRTSIN